MDSRVNSIDDSWLLLVSAAKTLCFYEMLKVIHASCGESPEQDDTPSVAQSLSLSVWKPKNNSEPFLKSNNSKKALCELQKSSTCRDWVARSEELQYHVEEWMISRWEWLPFFFYSSEEPLDHLVLQSIESNKSGRRNVIVKKPCVFSGLLSSISSEGSAVWLNSYMCWCMSFFFPFSFWSSRNSIFLSSSVANWSLPRRN